jgi:hypothetical protein
MLRGSICAHVWMLVALMVCSNAQLTGKRFFADDDCLSFETGFHMYPTNGVCTPSPCTLGVITLCPTESIQVDPDWLGFVTFSSHDCSGAINGIQAYPKSPVCAPTMAQYACNGDNVVVTGYALNSSCTGDTTTIVNQGGWLVFPLFECIVANTNRPAQMGSLLVDVGDTPIWR